MPAMTLLSSRTIHLLAMKEVLSTWQVTIPLDGDNSLSINWCAHGNCLQVGYCFTSNIAKMPFWIIEEENYVFVYNLLNSDYWHWANRVLLKWSKPNQTNRPTANHRAWKYRRALLILMSWVRAGCWIYNEIILKIN